MFYYNNKRLLSEGMSLDQIKQGLNADLLEMLESFTRAVIYNSGYNDSPIIKNFFIAMSDQIDKEKENGIYTKEECAIKWEKCKEAYAEFVLINVIENGQPLTDKIDINNPTGGVRGKFTEFILRIVSIGFLKRRGFLKNYTENWPMITEFLKICKVSGSNLYKSKNMFFDNVIIPLMNERVASGEKLGSVNPETGVRGANFSRPSVNAPLQDKVMKVFEAYGIYNEKNLLETILDEVVPEKANQSIETFAGYDKKLIEYCVSKGYWKEFQARNQPNTTRLFFISNGDLKSLNINSSYLSADDIYDQWMNLDYEERERWNDEYLEYLDYTRTVQKNDKYEEVDTFSYYFTHRALIYACNIYPFKTPFNIAKESANITSADIAYFKSLSANDYIVTNDKPEFKIRKTTDWCTKDENLLNKYVIPNSDEKVDGFILCLNDALSYNDPNGALQIGIKEIYPDKRNKKDKYLKIDQCINANDQSTNCPTYLFNYVNETHMASINPAFFGPKQPEIYNVINQANQNYDNLKNLKFPENVKLSNEEKKMYFEKIMKTQTSNSINEKLLRHYIRYLLS